MDLKEFKDKILKAAFTSTFRLKLIENLIKEHFMTLPIPTVDLHQPFLARCRYNRNGEVFGNVSQLSYNPVKKNITLQRCNYARQQVFYGAISSKTSQASIMSTAIVETCMEYIKQDDVDSHYLTLSRWQIKRPLSVFILPYAKDSISKNEDFKKAKNNYDQILTDLTKNDTVKLNHLKSSLEFISEIFCKYENKANYYKISSAYFNFIMQAAERKNIQIDGLVYPSANTEAAGMNIVLKKDIVDDGTIYCDRAIMYKGLRNRRQFKNFMFADASNESIVDANKKIFFSAIW